MHDADEAAERAEMKERSRAQREESARQREQAWEREKALRKQQIDQEVKENAREAAKAEAAAEAKRLAEQKKKEEEAKKKKVKLPKSASALRLMDEGDGRGTRETDRGVQTKYSVFQALHILLFGIKGYPIDGIDPFRILAIDKPCVT